MPATLLRRRCALTAPFHPYPGVAAKAVYSLWHFPSAGLEPGFPDVIRHTALWSSDFPPSFLDEMRATVRSSCQHIYYMRWDGSAVGRPSLDRNCNLRIEITTNVEERAFRPASNMILIFAALKAPLFHGPPRSLRRSNWSPLPARLTFAETCFIAPGMIHHVHNIIEIIAILGATSSIVYYLICLWSASRFLQQQGAVGNNTRPAPASLPVSILKPLKGTDPGMYESLRSHCLQNYPEYEIIFGVSDPDDPAIELVVRLQDEFPEQNIRLIHCEKILGANVKVSNLAQMLPLARFEFLVMNDSDIRVEPDYLQKVIPPLADPKAGLVTCLYRGVAASTLGSKLESLGISTDFAPGVLTARSLESIRFGLGSTLAFRRSDLARIGGFEALVDYLADDYQIGSRIADLGLEVKLSEVVVETYLPAYDLRGFIAHQLRWGRTIRDSRPWGYVGLLFTFGLPWALLALIASQGTIWSWALLGATGMIRLCMALVVGRVVLQDRQVTRWMWLIPLRDVVGAAVWLASFVGHTIDWRGERFSLNDGRLKRVGEPR
jgi:ceramide glucosyltransferase